MKPRPSPKSFRYIEKKTVESFLEPAARLPLPQTMARTSHLSPENLLRFLQVKSEPASANDIARGLHLGKSDRRPLFKILTQLKKRNAIEELPGGRYRLSKRKGAKEEPAMQSQRRQDQQKDAPQSKPAHEPIARDEIKGRLVLHHDGYGF